MKHEPHFIRYQTPQRLLTTARQLRDDMATLSDTSRHDYFGIVELIDELISALHTVQEWETEDE